MGMLVGSSSGVVVVDVILKEGAEGVCGGETARVIAMILPRLELFLLIPEYRRDK
jgi:hypothetical protein